MLNFHLNTVQQLAVLAIQLGVIIFAAKLCGDLAKKFKMPSVLGELAAGIIIGPYVLGGLPLPLHGLEEGLFAFTNTVAIANDTGAVELSNVTFSMFHSSLYAIATLGSILLLFMSGLETDLKLFFRYSVVGTVVGIGGVIFSFAFGGAVGMLMLKTSFMDPRCLYLGILCTATSVGITARILSERKKIDTPEGVTILAAAVIDDVLGIICLAIVGGIIGAMSKGDGGSVNYTEIALITVKCVGVWLGATVVGLLLAKYIAKFLKIFKSPVIFANLAFGLALMVGGLFEQASLAMIIGAYVMGLSLSKTDISFAVQHALHPLYNFLVPVFFVVMGMLVDIRVLAEWKVLKIGIIYSLLAILAKILVCAIPALFMNFNMLGALRIGAGMVPRGEVALIIAGIGAGTMITIDGVLKPVLDSQLFGVAIIMTLATTVVAPPLLAFILGIGGKGVRKETKDMTVIHTNFKLPSGTVAEFVLRTMTESLENEGFMLSQLDRDTGVLQIRKDDLSFALTIADNEFIFESNPDEVPFINTLMYETFVDLHQALEKLKKMSSPKELGKELFVESTPENGQEKAAHRSLVEKALYTSAIKMKLEATTKEGVITELVNLLWEQKLINDRDACVKAVLDRENIVTTCMQNGVALPHGKTDGTNALVSAVGICKDGYSFDSMDGKKSKVFVLCLSPKSSSGPHVEFIASIAGILSSQEAVERVVNAASPSEEMTT